MSMITSTKTIFTLCNICLFILFVKGEIAVATPSVESKQFTNEQQLSSRLNHEIKTLWQQGKFSHFAGIDNARINYAAFVQENIKQKNIEQNSSETTNNETRQCLVIVPGRSEGYLKYQELTFDLYQQGYDIFIIDHRGQGISQRLLANKHKGYVVDFEHYNQDLHTFIKQIVNKQCLTKPYLLAHSMGGLIAARYLQKHPETVRAAVLSSPMIDINSGGIPQWLGKALIYSTEQLNQWFSNESWYFLGQGDVEEDAYQLKNFNNNPLMQSQIRYQAFTDVYRSTAELQLGGVTVHWLSEALIAKDIVFESLEQLSTPTLVLQAGADSVVDNDAQDEFCQQLNSFHQTSCPGGKPVLIENARHELFFELDKYREPSLNHIIDWFAKF